MNKARRNAYYRVIDPRCVDVMSDTRSSMTWNPQQYLKFGNERLRPAHDLIARILLDSPQHVVDLGCGTGTVTALLHDRWPGASIIGVDNSSAMLDRARQALPAVKFEAADITRWAPPHPVDLIVSNAALHWVDDHAELFPRLVSHLTRGGVLAVQMPAQHRAPSHVLGYELAESARWRTQLQHLVRREPVLEPQAYHAILARHVAALDVWSTEYLQLLRGDNPVAEFTKGSFVGVWLAALSAAEARDFEAQYRNAIAAAYPPAATGETLFPFRRFFLVAQTRNA